MLCCCSGTTVLVQCVTKASGEPTITSAENIKLRIWQQNVYYFLTFKGKVHQKKLNSVIIYPSLWLPFFCRTQKKIFGWDRKLLSTVFKISSFVFWSRKAYRIGTTWVINDRIFIFGWTIHTYFKLLYASYLFIPLEEGHEKSDTCFSVRETGSLIIICILIYIYIYI